MHQIWAYFFVQIVRLRLLCAFFIVFVNNEQISFKEQNSEDGRVGKAAGG